MELRIATQLVPRLSRSFASSTRIRYALPAPTSTTTARPAPGSSSSNSRLQDGISVTRPSFLSRPSRAEIARREGGSVQMLLDGIGEMRSEITSKFDVSKMADPRPLQDIQGIMSALQETVMVPKEKTPMRLTPTTGRTVMVGTGVDLGRAIRVLEQNCSRNKVRSDFTKQRFHERGGLKRKRLRRERWRAQFKLGFKQVVDRVKHLKKQGW